MRILVNYQGSNAGNYRGYFRWDDNPTGWTQTGSCSGGGYYGKYNGYGSGYVDLISCSTSTSGNQRTVNFVFHANTNWGTDGPLTNNDISGWTRDDGGLTDGWDNFDLNFSVVSSTGTISGYVWEDKGVTGDDGIWDVPGESGFLTSVVIVRDNPSGTTTATESADGSYSFANVPLDTAITVSVDTSDPSWPAGWRVTGSCVDGVGSANCSGSLSRTVTLTTAGQIKEIHFGVSDNPSGWFQSRNGDVYGRSVNITLPDDPPGVAAGFDRWFLDADPNLTAGGVVITEGTTSVSDSRVSQRPDGSTPGWSIVSYGNIPWPAAIDAIDASHPGVISGDIIYDAGIITINTGNLATYTDTIVVAGEIIIEDDVALIDAILISKGPVTIEDRGALDDTLVINGALYAEGLITVAGELSDNGKPALLVNYNPAYLLQTIPGLTESRVSWKEVKSP